MSLTFYPIPPSLCQCRIAGTAGGCYNGLELPAKGVETHMWFLYILFTVFAIIIVGTVAGLILTFSSNHD